MKTSERKSTVATKTHPIFWGYEDYVSAEEFIRRAHSLVSDSLHTARELEGDMHLSDWRNLLELGCRLDNAVEHLDSSV